MRFFTQRKPPDNNEHVKKRIMLFGTVVLKWWAYIHLGDPILYIVYRLWWGNYIADE